MRALEEGGGDGGFARRYLLFRHGVAVPAKVISYYRASHYRRYCCCRADVGREDETGDDGEKENRPPDPRR